MKVIFQKLGMLIAVLLGTLSTHTYAYDFEVDGIYYNYLSAADKTVEVTAQYKDSSDNIEAYKGSVIIPEMISYNNLTLTVVAIGKYAFAYCDNLTGVSMPSSILKIGDHAFAYNYQIDNIEIPSSVELIQDYAFYGCTNLNILKFLDSSTELSLGESAFSDVKASENLYIGRSLKNKSTYSSSDWEYYALSDICPTKLIIGKDVQHLNAITGSKKVYEGDGYYWGNQFVELKSITCYATTPPVLKNVFSHDNYINVKVLIPFGTKEAYENSKIWNSFWNIEEMDEVNYVSMESKDVDTVIVTKTNLYGWPVDDSYEGVVIIRYSDGTTKKILQK